MMTADEFLQQIKTYDTLVNCKLEELQRLYDLVTQITSATDKEVVQTSGASDKVGKTVAKIIDLQNEINDTVDEYVDIRRHCIKVIEMLENPLQYKVIHMHYVQYKTYADIEREINYSYPWIMDVRKAALKEIERIINDKSFNLEKTI